MTQKHAFSNEFPGNWRLIGEIELSADAAIKDHIEKWLLETLRPLDLNARLFNKILASAELASGNDPLNTTKTALEHVHLLIYTPEDSQSNGHSWGFFRVEKKGDPQLSETNQDHAIAFYLYQEGL